MGGKAIVVGTSGAVVAAVVAAVLIANGGGAGATPTPSSPSPTAPGLVRVELARGQLQGGGPIEVRPQFDTVVQRITLPPGASSPWHRHHDGGVLVVESGTMSTYGLDHDLCRATDVPAGQAVFVPPHPGHPHLVRNRGSEPLSFVAYYFNVPPGQPASMPEPGAPAACPTPTD